MKQSFERLLSGEHLNVSIDEQFVYSLMSENCSLEPSACRRISESVWQSEACRGRLVFGDSTV